MATGDSILEGLGGMQFSPMENPYGIGAATLATSLPKLINPSGNFGTNLGIALGGTLLTSLMGYQARSTAADLSSRATQLGLDIMSAQTPEQRMTLANAADTGFYGPEVKSKALNLVSALEAQQKINALTAQQQYDSKLKELEAMISPEGEKYIAMQTNKMLEGINARGENALSLEDRKQANRFANMAKAAEIKGNLGWLNNQQKLALDISLKNAETEAIKAGTDPDTMRAMILADYKAAIDKNKMDAQQANDLQKIALTKKLDAFAKDNALPPKEKLEISESADVASDAYALANYIEQQTYFQAKMGMAYSMADDNSLAERINMLEGKIRKSMTGLAASIPEMKMWRDTIRGDSTAGVGSIVGNLRMVGDRLSQTSMTKLSQFSKSPSEIYNDLSNLMSSKQPIAFSKTLTPEEAPSIPAPASAGMNILKGLNSNAGAMPDVFAQLSADEERIKAKAAQELQTSGVISEETRKAAIALKATKQELGM